MTNVIYPKIRFSDRQAEMRGDILRRERLVELRQVISEMIHGIRLTERLWRRLYNTPAADGIQADLEYQLTDLKIYKEFYRKVQQRAA